jgi:hypothetical protein
MGKVGRSKKRVRALPMQSPSFSKTGGKMFAEDFLRKLFRIP